MNSAQTSWIRTNMAMAEVRGLVPEKGSYMAHRLASCLTPSPLPCCDTTNKRWEENTLAGNVTEGHRRDCAVGSPLRGWKSLLLRD